MSSYRDCVVKPESPTAMFTVRALGVVELDKLINEALRKGWAPYGTIVMGTGGYYLQQMAKYDSGSSMGPM